jgi:hypothetical protein
LHFIPSSLPSFLLPSSMPGNLDGKRKG